MPEPSSELASRLDRHAARLAAIERRLRALETASGVAEDEVAGIAADAPEAPPATEKRWLSSDVLPRFGRTFVVLGGAFLLRAATEGGTIPQVAGTVLGLVYAMLWLVMADRAALRGRRRSATLHGVAATAIAFPLLWEATVKFRFLTPMAGAAALAAITTLGLVVVTRRRLTGLASMITFAAAITTLALAFSTRMWALFVFELLLLALAVLWIGYERNWRALGWSVSGLVGATILLMTAMLQLASEERAWSMFSPQMLLAIQLSWVVTLFGTLGYHKLRTREELSGAEIVIALLTLLAGFGGATIVQRTPSVSVASFTAVSFVLAAGLYGFAFAFADRKLGRRLSFVCYSTAALIVTIVAFEALFRGPALTVALCVAAVTTAWLGARRARATLSLHSVMFVVAASAASGLLAGGFDAFAAVSTSSPGWITPWVLLILVVAAMGLGLPVTAHGRTWGSFSRAPVLGFLVLLVFGIGAIAVTLGETVLVWGTRSELDAGVLAALRTGVLGAIAVALGLLSRYRRWTEAYWLVYPALGLGALKLLLVDVQSGRPVTLFFSFVLYGGALILAPRLARRNS